MKLPNIETCQFVPISSLRSLLGQSAFELLEDQMSISHGDANRSLIPIERFKEELNDVAAYFENEFNVKHSNYLNEFLAELELKSVYIDLEN